MVKCYCCNICYNLFSLLISGGFRMTPQQQAIREFESMINLAELRALSSVSLERPITNSEFSRIMELKEKVFGNAK
jgi:hypothetical protein